MCRLLKCLAVAFLILSLSSSVGLAGFKKLKPEVDGKRFYSCDRGSRSILAVTSGQGTKENIDIWLFRKINEYPEYIQRLTTLARPGEVDVYWNPDERKYVVSWMASKATVHFALINPDNGGVKIHKVKIKSKKKARTCHTTYNKNNKTYFIAIGDGKQFEFADVDANSLKLVSEKTWYLHDGNSVIKTDIGDVLYAPGYDRYLVVLILFEEKRLYYLSIKGVGDEKLNLEYLKYYYSDLEPEVSLFCFEEDSKQNKIFLSYSHDDPSSGIYDVITNGLNKQGRPRPVYWEYTHFSDLPVSLPAFDYENNKVHFIFYEESDYHDDAKYKLDASMRLYTVGPSGVHYNGPSGEYISRMNTPTPSRFGVMMVDGEMVIFYVIWGKAYFEY